MAIPKVCLTQEPVSNSNMEYVCRKGTQVQFDDTTDLIACCHPFLPTPFAHPALCHMLLLFPLFWYSVDNPLSQFNLLNP